MSILKLKPYCRDTIWGGDRLKVEYGMQYDGPNLAEAWMLSCHPDGPCIIENGAYAGRTLPEYIEAEGRGVLGSFGLLFQDFPILTKFIDARDKLSVQVHPSNLYAMTHEHQYGKTEMWYILNAEPGAFLYYGFEHAISKEEFARRIQENTLPEVLHKQPVKKGECYFIPSGTLHAIGAGILIAEIQQNSNVTYRIYDYARRGADGKQRELHVEQAKAVTQLCPARTNYNFGGHLARCEYFTVDVFEGAQKDLCDDESFTSLLILEGSGTIQNGSEQMTIQKGDSLFLPAASGEYTITGNCRYLRTRVGTI
jgi:mannose-6-phosphate isomerase